MCEDCPACPYPGTIRNSTVFGEHFCPVECTAKLLMFIGVSIIILYVPLGKFTDCEPNGPQSNSSAMCCLCDVYKTILHVGQAMLNLLYNGKLQFYRLLGTLDYQDLCRSACCDEDLRCRCSPHKASKSKHKP